MEFITVTHRQEHLTALEASIRLAVGELVEWRLTVVDGTRHDLFNGYNHGAVQTRGELLAFVHDDVQLMGNPLTLRDPLQRLQDPRTGFIGVAGTRLLDRNAIWWGHETSEETLLACRGMAAHVHPGDFGMRVAVWPAGNGEFGRVVVLDGALLMCHRRTFETLQGFDAATFSGFHFYDLDITLRASLAGLANYAAPIPILHASSGEITAGWHENRRVFLRKHGHLLPAAIR